jgi:hypothetical protein
MFCGRCCVTEPRSRLALRLDIFIEILPCTRVNKGMKKGRGPKVRVPGLLTPPPHSRKAGLYLVL